MWRAMGMAGIRAVLDGGMLPCMPSRSRTVTLYRKALRWGGGGEASRAIKLTDCILYVVCTVWACKVKVLTVLSFPFPLHC